MATDGNNLRLRSLESVTKLVWTPEYKFCDTRRWKFDFACEALALAIEIEGGVFTRGRHSRGTGMVADMEKYNTAILLGWRLLRYTPQQFDAGHWIPDIEAVLRKQPE